jgi:hypothetical protein
VDTLVNLGAATVVTLLSVCRPHDAPSIVAAVRSQLSGLAAANESVSIHTFGFGADHDARLLQAVAEAGHGIYYFIKVRTLRVKFTVS